MLPPVAPRTLPRVLVALAAVALAGFVVLLSGAPAGAHGGEGEMEVTALTREGDDVTVTVHMRYVEDGHGVPDATVTVVVDDGTPTPMAAGAEEGDYTATVTAPPGAAIRVTSVEPEVTVDATAPEAAPTTTVGTTTTDATATTEATTEPAETTAAATTEASDAPESDGANDDGDDDGSNALLIGGLVALVVVLGGAAAFFVLRKPTPDADDAAE